MLIGFKVPACRILDNRADGNYKKKRQYRTVDELPQKYYSQNSPCSVNRKPGPVKRTSVNQLSVLYNVNSDFPKPAYQRKDKKT